MRKNVWRYRWKNPADYDEVQGLIDILSSEKLVVERVNNRVLVAKSARNECSYAIQPVTVRPKVRSTFSNGYWRIISCAPSDTINAVSEREKLDLYKNAEKRCWFALFVTVIVWTHTFVQFVALLQKEPNMLLQTNQLGVWIELVFAAAILILLPILAYKKTVMLHRIIEISKRTRSESLEYNWRKGDVSRCQGDDFLDNL